MIVSNRLLAWIDDTSRRFAHDRAGAMAITLGLLTTSFAGMVAVSVDVSDWYTTHRSLQAAADAAALGGATALYEGKTNSQATAAATTDAQLNLGGLAAGASVHISIDPNTQAVTATISKQEDMLLSGVIMGSASTITASATAGNVSVSSGSGTPYCLIVTNPSVANALYVTGGSAIQASGCNVVVDSTADSSTSVNTGTDVNNGSQIKAKSICGPGSFYGSTYTPTATTCPALSDPLANFTAPSIVNGGCDFTNYSVDSSNSVHYTDSNNTAHNLLYQSSVSLSPGVYCGGINLGGGAPVTLNAGASGQTSIYVLRGGGLTMNNSSPTVTGNGVSLYLTGSNSYMNVTNGSLTITAPKSGTMAGIAIYQDNSSSNGTLTNTITNSGVINFTGVLYFGHQNVTIAGGAQNKPSAYSIMIAYELNISNGSTLYLNSNYSNTTVPVPSKMYPTSQVVALTQ